MRKTDKPLSGIVERRLIDVVRSRLEDEPVLIDEFQHAPQLLDAIKAQLNRDGAAGRFLTGSTRYATPPRTAQALTGRVHQMDVLPLSQGEIAGVRDAQPDQAASQAWKPGHNVGPT